LGSQARIPPGTPNNAIITHMHVFIPNKKNKLTKTVLGSVPTPEELQKILKKSLPRSIENILEETHEDLLQIKKTYEKLGVEVITLPVEKFEDALNVRDGFVVIDDHMYITEKLDCLEDLYESVDNKTFVPHRGHYSPNIYINDDYVILDGLEREQYKYWRELLSPKRKIITAFNKGHADGIYCNVADKIWLTNGNVLNYKKYWPNIPVMELSTTNGGNVNHWPPIQEKFRKDWLKKTNGRYVIYNSDLKDDDVKFIDEHLKTWVGYCEETLFDINLSVIDSNNVMVISQNSEVYDRLESLDIKVHKVPFRHRFFWDGGLHCITNDLVREKI